MVDILEETAVPIADVSDHLPGKRVHACTVTRWQNPGVRGIRLETYAIGGKVYTTVEAIRRFIRATTEARNGAVLAAN